MKSGTFGPDQVRALRGALSRTDFARELGVTPVTVYRWELPDGSPEARRPRGRMMERLRAFQPPAFALPPAAAQQSSGPALPPDAALVLPALQRVLYGKFQEADDELTQLLRSSALASTTARTFAQASHALCLMLWRHDARAALQMLGAPLREAEEGALPGEVELVVRATAALVFSSPDGRSFDVGRVNAQVVRVEQLARSEAHYDLLFLARLGALSVSLHTRSFGASASEDDSLAEMLPLLSTPVARLLGDEVRCHFMCVTSSSSMVARLAEVAARAATLGVPVIEARCLAASAISLADEAAPPHEILDFARRARVVAAHARLPHGVHAMLALKAEVEAYMRLGRLGDADRALEEWLAVVKLLEWSARSGFAMLLRLFEATGRAGRACDVLESVAVAPRSEDRATLELVYAAREPATGAALLRLEQAEQRFLDSGPPPHLFQDMMTVGVLARITGGALAEARASLRVLQRHLDRCPSVASSARAKKLQALLVLREGKSSEAVHLLGSALSTFVLAHDTMEAAATRHWLAQAKQRLGTSDAAALVASSKDELTRLGMVPWPPHLELGSAESPASAPSVDTAQSFRLALDRLSVRGLAPRVLQRELVATVAGLFSDCAVLLEEIDGNGQAKAVCEQGEGPMPDNWWEFGDGMGARFRLGVGKALSETAADMIAALVAVVSLASEVGQLRGHSLEAEAPDDDASVTGLVAASPAMRRLKSQIMRLCDSTATVILYGESGVGKELVARAIHQHSQRAQGPYVTLNCAAVPRDLFEAQLFGHRRGAFTGAASDSPGMVRAADGGTLFLDEIAEVPLDLQAKLLRFLENREVQAVGETRALPVDVRVVAATHRDLGRLVREGKFREDLYYRLQVVPMVIPPLRERREDVLELARHFLRLLTPAGAEPPVLASDARARLIAHSWPGNVRELRNVIERSIAFAPLPRVLTAAHVRLDLDDA